MRLLKQLIKWFSCSNRMYTRLSNLFNYCTYLDLNEDKIQVLEECNDVADYIVRLEFKSKLGAVRIEISKCCLGYYTLKYTNYAGIDVFSITAYQGGNDVKPLLGKQLTAENIDLAIFELEDYLYQKYGEVQPYVDSYNKTKNVEKKLHEKELSKLL